MSRLTRVIPPIAPPISPLQLAEHLRLPTAAPETEQTAELARLILAATRHLESRLDMAFVEQVWRWRLKDWSQTCVPILPALRIESVNLTDADGNTTTVPALRLDSVAARPKLAPSEGRWPSIPMGGHAEIRFAAGFGPQQEDVPEDIRHAVQLLAAHFYENREAVASAVTTLPLGVASLIAPYRPIRL